MPKSKEEAERWTKTIHEHYMGYLQTSFYFKCPQLRESFRSALQSDGLVKGPIAEESRAFRKGVKSRELAEEYFPDKSKNLMPALYNGELYMHQEHAVRATYAEQQNVVVATGTASGKTESFLYPILFELYHQHLTGKLSEPGVRAMILYPMNALANDQRQRLGEICHQLKKEHADFNPTFGQYIGQTPENQQDHRREAQNHEENRMEGELVFRVEMRKQPPHILLTNYSMLEYLLIRPDDSPLFDDKRGCHWQFIVLDEAHQYRGTKGMELGMLIRRLKQRLREGGRKNSFRCIATSATIASDKGEKDRKAVARFATELFGEKFSPQGIIFGEDTPSQNGDIRRFHVFLRALEGAFLIHEDGKDSVVLNRRKKQTGHGTDSEPLEIALCRECGQCYYVGSVRNGKLEEAVRDPSQSDFGVDYSLPIQEKTASSCLLCRRCGKLSDTELDCDCGASIRVKKCKTHQDHPDCLKECEICNYGWNRVDPVQEIVHGSDGPNAVIATAIHALLPEGRRKVLAFADSRQGAAFFAWYAQNSYENIRDRNLILRAIKNSQVAPEGLSIADLGDRLFKQWERVNMFDAWETQETRRRKVQKAMFREIFTEEKRISLSGTGLVVWQIQIPNGFKIPKSMRQAPWNLNNNQACELLRYLLDEFRIKRAITLPENDPSVPSWQDISPYPQSVFKRAPPREWGSKKSAIVKHFLCRLLENSMSNSEKLQASVELMQNIWDEIRAYDRKMDSDAKKILHPGPRDGSFRLRSQWLRVKPAQPDEVFECAVCASVSTHNIRNVCPRNRCPGNLVPANQQHLAKNHYRMLYQKDLPPNLHSEEHTAQIDSETAQERQAQFKSGKIHLLSSSTTFEIGVDLGDLEVVFLRNVPPESFNYTQRVGRTGRRKGVPGLALTYCRRNPHDLYHYEKPEERIIRSKVQPPRLQMTNDKIISRHMVAVMLAAFFKQDENHGRFKNVEAFIGNWNCPSAILEDLRKFCKNNDSLRRSLCQIVPQNIHDKIKLNKEDGWIDKIIGTGSRIAWAVEKSCSDHNHLGELEMEYRESRLYQKADRVTRCMNTIEEKTTLDFLAHQAIIPKYGFPVDLVELDTHPSSNDTKVRLQRDLSQAIAEYAPGSKVVANKKEWTSWGIKKIPGKEWPVTPYTYDDARNFKEGREGEQLAGEKKYLSPVFGFVTPLFKKPVEPYGRSRRLYTTRPFFSGFDEGDEPTAVDFCGVRMTKAQPGNLIVLCEGKNKEGFYICELCGSHMTKKTADHKTATGSKCRGSSDRFSLGHKMVTDVVRLQFSGLVEEWDAYSLAYAVLLGAAETMDIPAADLNVTISRGETADSAAIILYDNVPGGAGLVVQLEKEKVFLEMLNHARERVAGGCGCDLSCYGCLRSYRNQFAHPHLRRGKALEFLNAALDQGGK